MFCLFWNAQQHPFIPYIFISHIVPHTIPKQKGIAIMIEPAIEPKTKEAVEAYIAKGGKLKVGADVLIGLQKWETLVAKPEKVVDQLLKNMSDELSAAEGAKKFQPSFDIAVDYE